MIAICAFGAVVQLRRFCLIVRRSGRVAVIVICLFVSAVDYTAILFTYYFTTYYMFIATNLMVKAVIFYIFFIKSFLVYNLA